jgi:uncharacterized protein
MRRKDRQVDEASAIEILKNGEYGVLSMCTIDVAGYGIPMSYAYTNEAIYFHCATEGFKLESLKLNNKVSFCVVGKTELLPSEFATRYESVIVAGQIIEVSDDEKKDGLIHIVEKYSPNFTKQGMKYIDSHFDDVKVLKLVIQSITGKSRQ